MNLVKIGKMLVNMDRFIAFEFQDDIRCIWCYLPNAPVSHELEYISYTVKSIDEYAELKAYIESNVLNAYPEGVK